MDPLLPSLRRELRARAHYLHPVVAIGHHGMTPAVVHEIDVALAAHELIKVRIFSDDRAERERMLVRVCDALDCAAVQQIGKLLVLWRPRPVAEAAESAKKEPRKDRRPGAERTSSAPPGRRRSGVASKTAPAAGRVRVRTPGKAPAGVPRAAAPRRRRRAP